MIGFDKDFEKQCGEYLEYLYHLAEKRYNDCPDIDTLVQDTLTALIVKISLGKSIEYPKGFLSAVLKNKYNAWLREKYKAEYVEYSDDAISGTCNEIEEKEEVERRNRRIRSDTPRDRTPDPYLSRGYSASLRSRTTGRTGCKGAWYSARNGIIPSFGGKRSDQRGT